MDHRVFGKELTNLLEADLNRHKRTHSILPQERLRDHSLSFKPVLPVRPALNRTLPQSKPLLPKLEDPQMVPEYFCENLQFMKEQEKATYKLSNYIPTHRTVSQQSRAKLIDWLSELHYKYKMFPETIFTMVSLMDQYLSVKEVTLSELQLVGTAALFIAAKFEETYQVPQLKQLVSCCAGQYSAAEILEKEADIIKELNFNLIVNNVYKFFEPLCKIVGLQAKNQHLAQYVLQLALLQPKFLSYSPSLLASSAIYLVKKIRKSELAWHQSMVGVMGYKESDLKACAKDLCMLLENAGEIQHCNAIKKKFSSPAFHEVTRIRLQRKDKK